VDDDDRIVELVTAGWTTQAVHVAAALGLPRLLADEARTVDDLAVATGAHGPSLLRLLRALVTLDIATEAADGHFGLTSLGVRLGTVGAWAIWWGDFAWPEWGRLFESVTTGRQSREFSVENDPEAAAVFDRAMAELTRLGAAGIVDSFDFSPFALVADIGGGHGELLATILRAHPGPRGVLFDRPHAAEGARRYLDEVGIADRVEVVTGDVFDGVPGGADAYVLKSVLHDFDDGDASRILAVCRRDMPATATLVVVERVLPDRMEATAEHRSAARSDLHMLVAHGSRERTESEFRHLLAGAGFDLRQVVAAGHGLSVLGATVSG
jgi:predicted O-methyltransferase YrrM